MVFPSLAGDRLFTSGVRFTVIILRTVFWSVSPLRAEGGAVTDDWCGISAFIKTVHRACHRSISSWRNAIIMCRAVRVHVITHGDDGRHFSAGERERGGGDHNSCRAWMTFSGCLSSRGDRTSTRILYRSRSSSNVIVVCCFMECFFLITQKATEQRLREKIYVATPTFISIYTLFNWLCSWRLWPYSAVEGDVISLKYDIENPIWVFFCHLTKWVFSLWFMSDVIRGVAVNI